MEQPIGELYFSIYIPANTLYYIVATLISSSSSIFDVIYQFPIIIYRFLVGDLSVANMSCDLSGRS